jgi:hypothetical protein
MLYARRMAEFKRWCPSMRCVRLHVNDEEERKRLRKEVLADPRSFDVAVTTYDMVHSAHFGDALRTNIVWRWGAWVGIGSDDHRKWAHHNRWGFGEQTSCGAGWAGTGRAI